MRPSIIKTIILSFLSLSFSLVYSQEYERVSDIEGPKLKHNNQSGYEDYIMIGDSSENCRTGVWKRLSKDGIIYWQGRYVDCQPFETWIWYYPDGEPRKKIQFDSTGTIRTWSMFFNNVKMLELHCLSNLTRTQCKKLESLEVEIVNKILQQYTSSMSKVRDYSNTVHYVYYSSDFDYQSSLQEVLMLIERFEGRFGLKLYDYHGMILNEYYYCSSIQKSRIKYEYRLKRLHKKCIFRDSELKMVETFDKNGVVTKTKVIKSKT